MERESGLVDAAQLFKVLGNESRLWLLRLLEQEPRTVGALSDAAGLSQPLVSQHLRLLRHAGLASATRKGKEVTYRLTDEHVAHIVADALIHVREPLHTEPDTGKDTHTMTDANPEEHKTAEHTVADHKHGEDCGHEAVQHGDHVDYLHDGHRHAEHGDLYDEH